MSLTKSKGGQGTPGTARMGNMPYCEHTDGRGGEQQDLQKAEQAALDAQRPGPARRVTRAFTENARQGRLNPQGLKGNL